LQNGRESESFPIPASGITSSDNFVPTDSALAIVVYKWAALPVAVRAGIVATVNAAVPDAAALSADEVAQCRAAWA